MTKDDHPITHHPITPSTSIGDLLEHYPELEDVLIDIAPPFKKLKNPFLRKSVAKVASLRQAAAVAGLSPGDLVNTLRAAVGQAPMTVEGSTSYFTSRPDWFESGKIVAVIDERLAGNPDEMPLKRVTQEATRLREGELLELITGFVPAPGIDIMKAKGFRVWSVQEPSGVIRTYFSKKASP